jgi:hypothetical protein
VIRTSDNALVDFVPLPDLDVFAGALTPDGEFLYVTERDSNDVALIRIANDTFLFTITSSMRKCTTLEEVNLGGHGRAIQSVEHR